MNHVATAVLCALPSMLFGAGCAHGADAAIAEALATANPARADAPPGAPPIEPQALTIAPTGLPPTYAPAIEPEAILPKMDEGYEKRQLPPGVQPGEPPENPER